MVSLRIDLSTLTRAELRTLAANARAAGNSSLAAVAEAHLAKLSDPREASATGGVRSSSRGRSAGKIAVLAAAVMTVAVLAPSATHDRGNPVRPPPIASGPRAYMALPSKLAPPPPEAPRRDQAAAGSAQQAANAPRAESHGPAPSPALPMAPSAAATPAAEALPPRPSVEPPIVVAASGELLPRDCGSGAYAGRLRCSGEEPSQAADTFTRSAAALNTNLTGNLLAPGTSPRR